MRGGDSIDFDTEPLKNRQENSERNEDMSTQEYLAVKVFSRVSNMYSCGFKNSQALIDQLGDPPHAKFYTVCENLEAEKGIQKTILMKRHLLLAINGLRAKSTGKTDQKFAQLVSVLLEGQKGNEK